VHWATRFKPPPDTIYQPAHFVQSNPSSWHALVRAHPLGTLITLGSDGFPEANEIPFLLTTDAGSPETLFGHVARANPLWHTHPPERDVLVVFKGPQAYVSPGWYATKADHGKVVPTWNYTVVQARGSLRVVDQDPDWLRQRLERLTDPHETHRAQPWVVGDAPELYVSQLMRAIVGFEITINHWCGKWKVSQNQPQANRQGVVAGLQAEGTEEAKALSQQVPI
jgi:transcriptional regulator